jgi:hypothetical protein
MKLVSLLLLFLTSLCFSWTRHDATDAWTGIDTANTANTYAKYDTLNFTKAFKLSAYENLTVIVLVNDTTVVRLANDSIGVRWGYQLISPCSSTTGIDTCFDQEIFKVDSILTTGFGAYTARIGTYGSDGVITRTDGLVDTLGPSGYATQKRNLSGMEWDVYIRFWVKGIANNKKVIAVPVKFNVLRRPASFVRTK